MASTKFKPSISFHPGVTLAEKLQELGVSVQEFAVFTSKPVDMIQSIINGEMSVTSDLAIAFEHFTHIPAHFWINKQRNYDAYKARYRKEAAASPISSLRWGASFLLEK